MDLLISFTDQSASFVHGVEFGRILEKMERGDQVVMNNGFPVRVENKAVIIQACRQFGYVPVFGHMVEGWIEFKAVKTSNKN